jgi:hypothetical protein
MSKAKFYKIPIYNVLVFGIGILSYFLLIQLLRVEVSENLMFDGFKDTADSFSYLQVGNWIFDQTPTQHLAYRPLLFPLILTSLFKIGGVWLVWLFQLLAYSFAHLLLHLAVKKVSHSSVLASLCSILFLSNFSLILLSYHALTEITVILGLSSILYLHSRHLKQQISSLKFWNYTVMLFGLLVLVKPVFLYPFITLLIILIIFLLRKKLKVKAFQSAGVLLVSCLILGQCFIVKANYGSFKVSLIGEKTVKNYLIAQTYQHREQVLRESSLERVNRMDKSELILFVRQNFKLTLRMYLFNIMDNIRADSYVENFKNPEVNRIPADYMHAYNRVLFFVLIALALIIPVQLIFLLRLDPKTARLILIVYLLFIYMVLISGIAFAQRDRLIITTLPIWIYLFAGTLNLKKIHIGYWSNNNN